MNKAANLIRVGAYLRGPQGLLGLPTATVLEEIPA